MVRQPGGVIVILWAYLLTAMFAPVALADIDESTDPAGSLRVVLTGQALIKNDLRSLAPVAVAQARAYTSQADAVFTNLEVSLDPSFDSLQPDGSSQSGIDPEVLDCLRDMGFNLLSLANNHALDMGLEGAAFTRRAAAERGFTVAGTGGNIDEAVRAGMLDTTGGRVALVAMASGSKQLTPDTWASTVQAGVNFLQVDEQGELDPAQQGRILDSIRAAAREAELVIAYQHNHYWGNPQTMDGPPGREPRTNRFTTPAWMEQWARQAIDAGADIYVAHGNPALHGIEIYRNGLILYGLGNYIFHSAGTPDKFGPLAFYGVVVDARFVSGELNSVQLKPLVLALDPPVRGAPFLARGGEAAAVLARLADLSRPYGTDIQINGELAVINLE